MFSWECSVSLSLSLSLSCIKERDERTLTRQYWSWIVVFVAFILGVFRYFLLYLILCAGIWIGWFLKWYDSVSWLLALCSLFDPNLTSLFNPDHLPPFCLCLDLILIPRVPTNIPLSELTFLCRCSSRVRWCQYMFAGYIRRLRNAPQPRSNVSITTPGNSGTSLWKPPYSRSSILHALEQSLAESSSGEVSINAVLLFTSLFLILFFGIIVRIPD